MLIFKGQYKNKWHKEITGQWFRKSCTRSWPNFLWNDSAVSLLKIFWERIAPGCSQEMGVCQYGW